MIEALHVGQAMGVVDDVDVDARIEYAARLDDVKTSMLQDFERGRSSNSSRSSARSSSSRNATASRCRTCARRTRRCGRRKRLLRTVIAPSPAGLDVGELSGVGAKTAPLFRELGIDTARALLDYLPFRYDDLRFPTPAAGSERRAARRTRSAASSRSKSGAFAGSRSSRCELTDDAGDRFVAKWIGRNRYVYGRFREGMRLFVRGRIERNFSGRSSTSRTTACWRKGKSIAASWFRSIVPAKIWRAARSPPS